MRRISIAVFTTILLCSCLLFAQQSDHSSQQALRVPPPGTVTGSGNANYIPLWTGSTTLGNSVIYQSGANVGIGTTTPATTLDVNGGTVNAATYKIGYNTALSTANSNSNIFVGAGAGSSNTTGTYDQFSGGYAGNHNTTGYENTFSGALAGYDNISGNLNTFAGFEAGLSTNTGSGNTFLGSVAGFGNTSGQNNTYVGTDAAYFSNTGNANIGLGYEAGEMNTSGNSNIYIGNNAASCGNPCTESSTIRIGGDVGYGPQTATYIAGIYGATSSGGIPVYINSNGQLGISTSSLRFKEQVRDMGDSTSALMKLRPVTFLYKPEYANGERTLQYGLIAEEVAKVYPELVAYDNDGQPYSVRYQYLSTMLLNEVQKQYRRAEAEAQVIKTQEEKIDSQQREMEAMQQRLSRLEALVGARVNTAQAATEGMSAAQ